MTTMAVTNLFAWSLQVACLVVAAALIARLVPVDSADVRHAWWRTVLVLCLALPVLQPWQQTEGTRAAYPPVGALSTAGSVATPPDTAGIPMQPPSGVSRPSAAALVGIAWALGAALRLAWLAGGLWRLRRLRAAGAPAGPSELYAELRTLVQADAEVRYVEALGQPVTFGIRRPVILLPSSLRALPDEVQRAVMAHELWHVRRRDWAWVLAEEALRSVVWFHPAMWWLISRVQSSREEVVDQLTVLLTSSRRSYLEALLAFADRPRMFPATPFAERRRLFTRMVFVSKEAVMSSKRIVGSCAGMLVGIAFAGWYGAAAFPLTAAPLPPAARVQPPPRDARPGEPRPATTREAALQTMLASGSGDPSAWMELARLQEQRGAVVAAEATLLAMRHDQPGSAESYRALAALHQRTGQFDRAIGVLEEAAALDPSDPGGYHILSTYFWEKATNDHTLVPTEKLAYTRRGIAAADRALAVNPEFAESLIYKNLLLRTQASLDPDAASRRALLTEADTLRSRALALRGANPTATTFVPNIPGVRPPPPPALALTGAAARADNMTPLRVGGAVGTPTKIRHVSPVYPADAIAAGIQGVVIIEAVIDESGGVSSARVLRQVPGLDEAALEAVRQWQFTPTLVDGAAVRVVMTVTINFTTQ